MSLALVDRRLNRIPADRSALYSPASHTIQYPIGNLL
jgi:hypothetical protein